MFDDDTDDEAETSGSECKHLWDDFYCYWDDLY